MPETFTYMWGALRVDVDKAKELIAMRKRKQIAVVNYDPDRFGVYVKEESLAKLPRPFEPGIMGTFKFWDRHDKKYIVQRLVIDGSHRAMVCKREGAQFWCHILNAKESESVTMYNALVKGKRHG